MPLSEFGAASLGLVASEPWVALTLIADQELDPDSTGLSVPARRTQAQRFRLSPTQISVLELLSDGLTAKEIAEVRGISFDTVRQHIKAMLRKVGARNQKQLLTIVNDNRPASDIRLLSSD